jgi:hypothetical protein
MSVKGCILSQWTSSVSEDSIRRLDGTELCTGDPQLVFCPMVMVDSIDAIFVSSTPYVMLFGWNLRSAVVTKHFCKQSLGQLFPWYLLSVRHGNFKTDPVSFILFCRPKPVFSERP